MSKKNIFIILTLMISISISIESFSQSSFNVSGGSQNFDSIFISQSIGQVFFQHSQLSNFRITEGVQQTALPKILVDDISICSWGNIPLPPVNLKGGEWNYKSEIGSSIQPDGIINIGENNIPEYMYDTLIYNYYGFTDFIEIRILPKPVANIVKEGNSCTNTSIQLYENGGVAKSWKWNGPNSFSSSSKNPIVEFPGSGEYIVEIQDSNTCINFDTMIICVGEVTANCRDINVNVNKDGFAEIVIDSLINSSVNTCGGIINYSINDTILTCQNGFEQQLKVVAIDSLGCVDSCFANVSIIDTISPVDVCNSVQDLVLLWDGTELNAVSIAGSSSDNCTQELDYSFFPSFNGETKIFDCSDLGFNNLTTIYIRDESGNISSCEVQINLLNEGLDCECDFSFLNFDLGLMLPGDYFAFMDIHTSGKIASGTEINLRAGFEIKLLPGFHAKKGSTFTGRIDFCNDFFLFPPLDNEGDDENLGFDRFEDQIIHDESENQRNNNENMTMNIYPNPTRNVANIEIINNNSSKLEIYIQQLDGSSIPKPLATKNVMEFEKIYFQLDVSNLPSGLYLISARTKNGIVRKKLVKI